MANPRSRPFNLVFHPNGLHEEEPGQYKNRTIVANAPPIEIENPHFKGHVMLIHDTGNEPGAEASDKATETRRGVELQIQGKFKNTVATGSETTHGLWIGGDLPHPLKLGWIMQNVVQLCMKYARKKTQGRLSFTLGGKDVKPHLSFPIGQLFTVLTTLPGETVPALGSEEIRQKKWQGAGWIDISSENTYTLIYKTPYMDLCSWDLLNVPGVSPLPIESILGDITTAHVYLYDLGITGGMPGCKPADWKQGVLLEWHFSRGEQGDTWPQEEDIMDVPTPPLSAGAKTPLGDGSERSEASERADDDAEEDILDVEEAKDDADLESEASSVESIEESEDEEAMSRADSQALFEIEAWRPRENADTENTRARVPYYIEAIDRRRRRKVRIWYIIGLTDPNGGDDWWHAKAATELAGLCRPRRRLNQFRRGPGARRYTCNAVKTLEQFRHVLRQQLTTRSKLRDEVLKTAANAQIKRSQDKVPTNTTTAPTPTTTVAAAAAAAAAMTGGTGAAAAAAAAGAAGAGGGGESGGNADGTPASGGTATAVEEQSEEEALSVPSPKVYSAAGIARKVRRNRGPVLPPRFFVGTGSACGLAFAHAREGRATAQRETLVGSIHFEGRLCEELLRLSSDGILRFFTPYDCDRPRARIRPLDLLHVQSIDGLFLGRFHLWQVQTVLRVFVLCSPTHSERAEWVAAIDAVVQAAKLNAERLDASPSAGLTGGMSPAAASSVSGISGAAGQASPASFNSAPAMDRTASKESLRSVTVPNSDGKVTPVGNFDQFSQKLRTGVGKVNSTLHSTFHMVSLKYALRDPGLTDLSVFFTDTTRARRWRNSRRLVLNDRLLLPELSPSPPPSYAADLLEQVLKLGDQPANSDIIAFSNAVCQLKAIRFRHWTQTELLAFWINIYHCLLLHGYLVLGKPVTAKELQRFRTRVSYLVGLRPISLREIEQAIFRIPEVDPQLQARAHAGAHARAVLGFCGCCRRRRSAGSPDREHEDNMKSNPPSVQGSTSTPPRKIVGAQKNMMCMPMPQIPKPTWSNRNLREKESCLFLGREPEALAPPTQDLRCILALNRGKKACPPTIPVLHDTALNTELDDVVRRAVQSMVQVELKDREGRALRVKLPDICKPLLTELSTGAKEVLLYLWQFMPPDTPDPASTCKLKFVKGAEEPWERSDLQKFTYTDTNLNQESLNTSQPPAPKEFDAVTATAKALEMLAAQPSGLTRGSSSDEVVITVRGLTAEGGQMEDHHLVHSGLLRL